MAEARRSHMNMKQRQFVKTRKKSLKLIVRARNEDVRGNACAAFSSIFFREDFVAKSLRALVAYFRSLIFILIYLNRTGMFWRFISYCLIKIVNQITLFIYEPVPPNEICVIFGLDSPAGMGTFIFSNQLFEDYQRADEELMTEDEKEDERSQAEQFAERINSMIEYYRDVLQQ
ncbi:unnamed protein product [Allacma fusca]|uniref:Uncharacterized protein n=1 Tax=Allacma fusca TaxID=39272 RepID=A0A8J2JQV5_9HEXA|nr:unnamed protein product [Allacma fusca]